MSGASLVLRDVCVEYPGTNRAAVTGVDLDVEAGAFVTLVGPSGCGKSTLLRSVNRLVPLQRGTVLIDGIDATSLDPVELRRSIGYAIQAVGLFTNMTVAENVGVVPSLLGWDRERIRVRVDEMLALVRLEPARYRVRKPRELSGGEAQRAGVARALAGNPRLLLMDEPFGALDAIVRRELQKELLGIVRSSGLTTLFVTHDVNESLHLSDRIAVMREGTIVQYDSPVHVLAKPADDQVAALFAEDHEIARLRAQARTT
jgi:osmoprotectant transport system ATP-binding protein